ncbi:MAG: glycosyltransferase [Bacteroidota bacterium]|nr:glycosyltransferase [Bacteroidota bacterium]
MKRCKILWLVSWYPNRFDKFDGDFIQRHARAAAIHHDIHVIFVKDANIENEVEVEWNYATGLTEQRVFIKKTNVLFKHFKWLAQYKHAINNYINKNGLPAIVHVHIPWKAGFLALWLKRKYKIPFIVTEHWGIYNDVLKENFSSKSLLHKKIVRQVFKETKLFTSVSKFLAEGILRKVVEQRYKIIPNVVDTTLFNFSEKKYSKFTFIHVSNMVPLKNVSGILNAFKSLITITHTDVQLIMIGNKNNIYKDQAHESGLLNKSIFFKGEITYVEVAKEMQSSHCLILNSHIENAPCVISEALCCGMPVISTDVGGISEMVDHSNGFLIGPDNQENLAITMLKMINEHTYFNRVKISEEAHKKYSYSVIAIQFDELYKEILNNE